MGQQQVARQEMSEMVGGDADLVSLWRARRRLQQRKIHGGVAHQRMQRQAGRAEGIDELADACL